MPDKLPDYTDWIGKTEVGNDIIAASQLDRWSATLDRDDPVHQPDDVIAPLAHWLFFLPRERQSTLGPDGHAKRGGFLPPLHELPRRMWAGSRISFPGPLRVGMAVSRRSTIASITQKQGAAGPLVFVTVRHEISEVTGGTKGAPLVIDEHDIVYRGLGGPAAKPAPAGGPQGAWQRSLTPDDVLLFRYSALTFNGHRIHYDRDYVTREEGYPGLVVHGPLIATLLVDLLRRQMPDAYVLDYSFRAVSPLFDGNPLHLNGTPPDSDGIVKLWATNDEGGLAMKAEARIATDV